MKKTLRTYHSNRFISYKTCKWCGLTKELSEFYDGRWGKKCKVCVRARAQKYRREHLEQYAQYEKARANKGGTDGIGNIQPLCGACNRKKFVDVTDYRSEAHILT